jgi:hypothetical protein
MSSPYAHLGASIVQNGNFLQINIEYGDEEFLHPEFIQRIDVSILNEQGLKLRGMSLPVDGVSSDGEGKFRLGMVIDPVEEPYTAVIGILSDLYGTDQVKVTVKKDTRQAIQGS